VIDKETLEKLYNRYNDRSCIHPDPLEFLYDYEDVSEREVAGIIASSLAYGQVKQILKSVSFVLKPLGSKPSEYLTGADPDKLKKMFSSFKHRFTTGEELAFFLFSIGRVLEKYGSLNECFSTFFRGKQDIQYAVTNFAKELRMGECDCYNSLMPMPKGKCAYKRVNLYLRWMVRRDNVDPGGWKNIPSSKLIVPVDIHMHRIALDYGLTRRKQADMKTAIEITESFRKFSPDDPVKYDFALTRTGIYSNNVI
jgi:uncharacterized protein (TIGR02757 family)